LRHGGRALRVAHADPDRQGLALPGRALRLALLAAAARLGARDAGAARSRLGRGPRAARGRRLAASRARSRARVLRDAVRAAAAPAAEAGCPVIGGAREEIRAGADPGDLVARLQEELRTLRQPRLRRVLNATGVVVHTNLGRAPLAPEAIAQIVDVARGYSNLELDLRDGVRGSRQDHVAPLLRRLTGAEAA